MILALNWSRDCHIHFFKRSQKVDMTTSLVGTKAAAVGLTNFRCSHAIAWMEAAGFRRDEHELANAR